LGYEGKRAKVELRAWENADDEGEGLPTSPLRQQTANAFGFQVHNNAHFPVRQGMLNPLRDACNHGRSISLKQYDSEGNPTMYPELIPLVAWLSLLIGLLLPTWAIYKITGDAVQKNFAQLKGKLSGFAIELGGPVAFYVLLAVLGKDFIPHDVEITLSGTVEGVDGQPLQDYQVASVNLSPLANTFDVQTKHNKYNSYSFLISKGGLSFLVEDQFVDNNNTKNIKISDFPDVKRTKIQGEKTKDNQGRQFPDGYSIDIIPIIRPAPEIIQDGKIEINIQHGIYKIVMHDHQKKYIGEDFLTDVKHGDIIILPHQLNISAME
jgi:hypothetical protein